MKRFIIFLLCALMLANPVLAGTRPLKEDTAVTIVVGPFVDTAGAAVTAPTIANIDITAYKNDGTAVTITPAASGTANDMVHVDDGYYSLELTATDSSTPGYLRLSFQITGALIFHEDWEILPANIYDSRFSTDKLQVDVVEGAGTAWNSGAIGATTLASDTITAAKIAADAITNSELATDAIGAAEIAADAIAASELATDAIGAAEVAANAITSAEIDLSGETLGTVTTVTNQVTANVTQWLGTAPATPTVAGVPEVDVTFVNGSAATPEAGLVPKLTGYTTVVHVPHTGNDTTSGTNLKAALAANALVKPDPGNYIITAPFTLPAGCKVFSEDPNRTILSFANGNTATPDVIPGTNSTLEGVTISESVDGFPVAIQGATLVTNALIKNCRVISSNLEAVSIESSVPCSVTFEDVYLESYSEWGMNAEVAAHQITWRNVTVMIPANASTTDFKGFGLDDGVTLIGDRVQLLTTEFSVGGQAIRLEGSSKAYLTNSSIFNADININDAGSYLLMVNCDFDRSQVTGQTARLVDVSDPSLIWDDPKSQHAIADTFGDYLDDEVSAGGGGGLDAAGVRAAIGLATANLDTQLADVPTVAELNARTLIAANYFDPAADAVATVTNLTNLPTIPANWLTAAGINANAFNAAKFDADVTTEIQVGLATAANLATVDDFLDTEMAATLAAVDTEIAAILVDTNELQTDWANGGRLDVILDAAGSAGDPWVTPIPGAYGAGTAGFIVGTNLNATVSSRSSQASVDTVDDFVDSEVAAIKARTDFLPSATAGSAGGVFIAGSNADTTVNLIGNLSGSVGSVTGNVGGSCAAVIGNVGGQVGAVTGNVGGNVTGSVGSISGVTFPTNFPTLGINASGHVSRVTVTDTVTSGSGLDAAGTRAALGLATANLDTQLTDIPTNAELATALDPLPTATENATQLLGTTITDTGVNTVGRFVSWLNATLDSSGVFDASSLVNTPLADMTQEQIDDIADAIVAAGATLLTDVDQEPVATSRTWILEPTGAQGLRGDAKSIAVGQEETFAFDFRKDMSVNDRIITVGTPVLVGTPSSGITFGTTGRDKSLGKLRITPTTAGTYTIRLPVVANSGGNKTGTVILKVSP